ncbi:hypothetical protein BVY00_00225 [bacterium G20]|nr:hypothetical protein BVY00_00225 [bacterium G20]
MSYTPSQEILDKYAKVLVNFALGSGKGIKKGDTVYLQGALSALPYYRALKKVIFDSGGHVIGALGDDMDGFSRYFYDNATNEQLTAFPAPYFKGLVESVDHRIGIISDHDVHELDKVDPKKIMLAQKSRKKVSEWFDKKENEGKHTWTLALYGTPSMADLTAGMYSDGTEPPLMLLMNSKPLPASFWDRRSQTWPYCPRPPLCRINLPSDSTASLRIVSR